MPRCRLQRTDSAQCIDFPLHAVTDDAAIAGDGRRLGNNRILIALRTREVSTSANRLRTKRRLNVLKIVRSRGRSVVTARATK